MNSEILIYTTDDGVIRIDVQMVDKTVWLTQAQMSQLFEKDKRTISEHIRNVFNEGELDENSVVRKFRTTAADGKNYAEHATGPGQKANRRPRQLSEISG